MPAKTCLSRTVRQTRVTYVAYVSSVTVCCALMARGSVNGATQIFDVRVFPLARHGELRYFSHAQVDPRQQAITSTRGAGAGSMSKLEAMSPQARRSRRFVPTGIALATAGVLVAVPAITPPLSSREAQVAADVKTALSTAQVQLTADSTALLKGLQLAANVLA